MSAAQATVDEDCPKCGHHQLEYYTMQLRSADEGQVSGAARGLRRMPWRRRYSLESYLDPPSLPQSPADGLL